MLAYDKDRHCWVEGQEAISLRIARLEDELEKLTEPDALRYAAMIRCPSISAAVIGAKAQIARLEKQLTMP